MHWLDADGACDYAAQGASRKPSRKTLYSWVQQGMRVARLGETGRRLRFSAEWIDEFLIAKAEAAQK